MTRKSPQQQHQQYHAPYTTKYHQRKYFVGALLAGAIIVAGLFFFFLVNNSEQKIDHSKYQVVYLVGGQAYFGKLKNMGGDYLIIESPYTAQSVGSSDSDKTASSDNTTTLLKVSSQVYGPEDSIAIKSSQVLFWQNLRADSKVSKAIDAKS